MKKIIVALLALIVFACNDKHSGHPTTKDSTSHTNHAGGNSTDSSATMMGLMDKMMLDMKSATSFRDTDKDFANLMKLHHQGAVQMARLEVQNGSDPLIKQMAQKMINDQQKEIAVFDSLLLGHQSPGTNDEYYRKTMSIMDQMKMDMDHEGSIDKQFVQSMIPHHQAAIDMSKEYLLANPQNERLKTTANNIITSQQAEIGALQSWLANNK